MTEEEKLAEEYYYKTYPVTLNIGEESRKKEVIDIFLAGLKVQIERLEKENEQLKQQIEKEKKFSKDVMNNELRLIKQIEKMKCCATCKYWKYEDIQKYCNKRTGTPEFAGRLFKCNKWELAE